MGWLLFFVFLFLILECKTKTMKHFLLLSLIVISGLTGTAQLLINKPDSIPVLGKLHHQLFDYSVIAGRNQLGTVYLLPKDKMPALRPDTTIKYKMPIYGFGGRIQPNPLKRVIEILPYLEPGNIIIIPTPDGRKEVHIH